VVSKPDEHTSRAAAPPQVERGEKSKPAESLSAQLQQASQSQPAKSSTEAGSEKTEHKSVSRNWDEIKRQVKKVRPPTEALLNSCSSVMLKENVLFLGFASDVVKSKMDTRENLAIVAPIISQIIGLEITIRCVVVNKNVIGSLDTAQNEDGMVNAALGLGGQIIQKE
jgi:DNA polymerase-3 subunit gamma/tau